MMASNNGPESNPRYCAVCRKYGGMLIDGKKLSMHRFPSSQKDTKVKKIWIKRCSLARMDFKFHSYTSTRICGEHFVGGNGPTKQHNLPSIFHSKTYQITVSAFLFIHYYNYINLSISGI